MPPMWGKYIYLYHGFSASLEALGTSLQPARLEFRDGAPSATKDGYLSVATSPDGMSSYAGNLYLIKLTPDEFMEYGFRTYQDGCTEYITRKPIPIEKISVIKEKENASKDQGSRLPKISTHKETPAKQTITSNLSRVETKAEKLPPLNGIQKGIQRPFNEMEKRFANKPTMRKPGIPVDANRTVIRKKAPNVTVPKTNHHK